jgi:hypothetical protein
MMRLYGPASALTKKRKGKSKRKKINSTLSPALTLPARWWEFTYQTCCRSNEVLAENKGAKR